MYVPKHFQVDDPQVLRDFLHAYDFATLITGEESGLSASHLPLLLDDGPAPRLLGHLARANPQWRGFDGRRQALAVFLGPHAYISPSWYESAPAVPTWNYGTVHVYGAPRVLESESDIDALLDRLVRKHEQRRAQPWDGRLPPDYRAQMRRAIVAFEMPIQRFEGKFKLGQNRSEADRRGALRGLRESGTAGAAGLAGFAERYLFGGSAG